MSQVILMIVMFILVTDLVILAFACFFSRDVLLRKSPGVIVWFIMLACSVIALFACCPVVSSLPDDLIQPSVQLLIGAVILTLTILAAIWAMENAKQKSRQIMAMIMTVVESGDPTLDEHSRKVAELSVLIYDFLPLRLRWRISRGDLFCAALLYDIGKLGIPNTIRNKSGKLTKEEQKLMQGYPEISVAVLRKIPSFNPVLDWILYHRERMDGTGFYHLKGKEIPLGARIIAVANVFAALTTSRPYRPSLSYEAAVEEMRQAAGTHLDPEIVEYFCEIPLKSVANCLEFETYSVESVSEKIMGE